MSIKLGKYSKFIVALGGFIALVVQVAADGEIDPNEIGVLATGAAVAAGVLLKRNTPGE